MDRFHFLFAYLALKFLLLSSTAFSQISFHHYNATIVHTPFFIREDTPSFSITVAKGKWHYDKWGQPWDPAPDGVHIFTPEPSNELHHLIAYLTGTSLALLDKTNSISIFENFTVSESDNGKGWVVKNNISHGFLPREAFCTENLMTLVKFLPHRKLPMDTLKFFGSSYHSYRIRKEHGTRALELTITMVLVDSKARHFQEAADRDFSYTHKIIDSQNSIHEIPRQYLNIERSIIGWGQVDGQILVKLSNLHPNEPLTIHRYHDISPFFLVPNIKMLIIDPLRWMRNEHIEYIPSNGDKSPNRLTLKDIEIKPLQTVSFRLYFEKLFLHVNDFPPDADHGLEVFSSWANVTHKAADSENDIVYGDGMLVSMPKPDFSMPFNVITLTSTVMAFMYGSVFNALVRKKRKKKSSKDKKEKQE